MSAMSATRRKVVAPGLHIRHCCPLDTARTLLPPCLFPRTLPGDPVPPWSCSGAGLPSLSPGVTLHNVPFYSISCLCFVIPRCFHPSVYSHHGVSHIQPGTRSGHLSPSLPLQSLPEVGWPCLGPPGRVPDTDKSCFFHANSYCQYQSL